MLEALFISPALMAALAVAIVVVVKLTGLRKPSVMRLVWLSLLFAVGGAGASLIFTIVWMIWYENSTGYSAGNAPLEWIFISGPASAALGQLLALTVWWFKKPLSHIVAVERNRE